MIASIWNMAHVRILNNHEDGKYLGLNGYMHCVYIFVLMGEVTFLSIRQGIGLIMVLTYVICSSAIIHTYHRDLLGYYLTYIPSYIFYINYVCYYVEKNSKINFLLLKKIKSLLDE